MFAELLLKNRRAAGLSQQQLAQLSGISVRALRELEHGRARAAQQRSAEVLADSLGLTGADHAEFLAMAHEGRRRRPTGNPNGSPALPPDLVGRQTELDWLRSVLLAGDDVAIVGQAGVGKTVMAAFAAHQLSEEFPDGCFAVDLRGMDERPLEVRTVFERLLRALGTSSAEIPTSVHGMESLYRSLLAQRRVLVVLDNAAAEPQVRPLMATVPGCRTLVTCRRRLAGLSGVRWLPLEPLAAAQANALLTAIAGEERVSAEPAEARELVELCGNLPLALRIAGDRLVTRPSWSLAHLVDQLRDERKRLTALSAGDLQVRSAFDLSYRGLSERARMVFRRLAVVPGADFGIELVRVATGLTEAEAFRHLDELLEASMVQETPVEGRFRFHDLLRIFAGERWAEEGTPAEHDQFRHAVLEHLLHMASAAGKLFLPAAESGGVFESADAARVWLDVEASNWIAALRYAGRKGWHREAVELAASMHWYSDDNWHRQPWEEIFRIGAAAAHELGDRSAEAKLLNFVGWALRVVKAFEPALDLHQQALRAAIEAGDRLEQMWALVHTGRIHQILGRPTVAMEMVEQGAKLSNEFDFWSEQVSVQYLFGSLLLAQGRAEDALEVLRSLHMRTQHYDLKKAVYRRRMATVLSEGVAQCLQALEQWEEATILFARCREDYTAIGALLFAAGAAHSEGRCWIALGEYLQADVALRFALATYGELETIAGRREEIQADLDGLP
ncbi:Predicted ATPase [Actinokineospora alba]|uniref:Predicted ATPase n=2 Tax=Actinokineospora alba TaxID=504798 RepID=A0A1H0L6G9_9PSEU|nr:putative ATPase [Actinokineospora alba]SDJ04053.1 Predicted ATPase [Actinokineospora alba]SDO63817.1 Predicted ATPase [Actinokineospora alba]